MARPPTPLIKRTPAKPSQVETEGARLRRPQPAKPEPDLPDDALRPYRDRRDFALSPEPTGGALKRGEPFRFVVQKHAARRLHYDLRLELDGVLKSWAVTRGPSLAAGDKRLAVHTEDHPLQYLDFEGVIPRGQYGGGTMIVWDQGRWTPEGDPREGYAKGRLTFDLDGKRLSGRWHLVRTRPNASGREQWLLLKAEDEQARLGDAPDILEEYTTSLLTGRTIEALAAEGKVRIDHAARERVVKRRSAAAPDVSRVPGARRAILPPFVEPCLASLAVGAPRTEGWIFEVKFDGYRLQARIDGGCVQFLTRSGLDWTDKFPALAEAFGALGLASALIDGEVVVEDARGASDFSALQAAIKEGRSDLMRFWSFDLLYLEGSDLRGVPLLRRKALLGEAMARATPGGPLQLSEHFVADGAAIVGHACRLGFEGVVAKRADGLYRSGRGEQWLKVKCTSRQEFVVCGYTPSSAMKGAVGSLILGVHDQGRLVHVGRAGTGFTTRVAGELWRALESLRRADAPFADKLPREAARDARFSEARLVCEVEFRGWTADGSLRHAVFKGLREDKSPEEVTREHPGGGADAPADGAGAVPPRAVAKVRLTHPDRVLWDDAGLTKQGLAEFYAEIAERVLPHVANRPLSLVRCPDGAAGTCFYQKHAFAGMDASVARIQVGDDEALAIQDIDGLMALVQASTLEIHPWGSTLDEPERPDRIVFDLDPDEGLGWADTLAAAVTVRERLLQAGLESLVKTTGGKGLHVVVPLVPRAGWAEVKAFAQGVAAGLARDMPERFTATLSKRARAGRLFIDYLRNGRGSTAIAAYSTRARAGAPVSTPVAWEELPTLAAANAYRVDNLLTRLDHLPIDPWRDIQRLARPLPSGGGECLPLARPGGRRRTR